MVIRLVPVVASSRSLSVTPCLVPVISLFCSLVNLPISKCLEVRTDRGKVLKSRMLGVQTAQVEAVRDCDQSVQRPGVRTKAMCPRQAETEKNC